MKTAVVLGSGAIIELAADERLIAGPEVAFLLAGYAYCAARRTAFDEAQHVSPAEYQRLSQAVDDCSHEVLEAMMALAPRSPRDVRRAALKNKGAA